jgi:glycosyltransferase involved in cell wall biosynthesis
VDVEYLDRPRGRFSLRAIHQAYALCRRVGCDVFQCDNIHTSPLIGAFLARVPVRVWFKRSMEPAYEECRSRTLRDRIAISVRVSSALATRVATVSGAVRDELVHMGISADKIVVINNVVPRPSWPLPDRSRARAEAGYGKDDIVFCTVGHAVPVKGWDVLVDAFGELARERADVRLQLAGSTNAPHELACYEALRRRVADSGLMDLVRFTGHSTDVPGFLAAADVFVLPSRSEGNSNALNEAFAAGLPCISTRVGNAENLIREGISGLTVEREDARALATAMRRLAEDAALRRRLADGTRLPVDSPSSITAYNQEVLRLYESLLQSSGRLSASLAGDNTAPTVRRR